MIPFLLNVVQLRPLLYMYLNDVYYKKYKTIEKTL